MTDFVSALKKQLPVDMRVYSKGDSVYVYWFEEEHLCGIEIKPHPLSSGMVVPLAKMIIRTANQHRQESALAILSSFHLNEEEQK